MEKLPDGTERLLNRLGYVLDRGVWRVAESGMCCPPAAVDFLERPDRVEGEFAGMKFLSRDDFDVVFEGPGDFVLVSEGEGDE